MFHPFPVYLLFTEESAGNPGLRGLDQRKDRDTRGLYVKVKSNRGNCYVGTK